MDFPLFINASSLCAALLTVLLFRRATAAVFPSLSPITANLALLLYLSSFTFSSTLGIYYRATKPLVALCLLAGLFVLRFLGQRGLSGGPPTVWLLSLFGLGTTASLLDRQGFFEVALGSVCLALAAVGRRKWRLPWLALTSAALIGLAYNNWIGPWLIHSVNGYWPSFDWQQISPDDLLVLRPYVRGLRLTAVYGGGLIGSLSLAAIPGLLVGLAAVLAPTVTRPGEGPDSAGAASRALPRATLTLLGIF